MLPEKWPLAVLESTAEQFRTVKKLIVAREVEYVVCATDAGREGELIFRFIYEAAGCRKPVRRLWISSLTPGAIKAGLQVMKDGRSYDSLAAAARGRAQADWLVGMNLSRAYTIAQGDTLSVGRVQTPTLAMLVEREKEIRASSPRPTSKSSAPSAPRPTRARGSSPVQPRPTSPSGFRPTNRTRGPSSIA